jgi:hypothetical protein
MYLITNQQVIEDSGFPEKTDYILSLRKFLAETGSHLVNGLHLCLSV